MLRGEAYDVVAPRNHDDRKSKVFGVKSKRRAVLSRGYGIEHDRVNPGASPQEIAHQRPTWHSADAVAVVLEHCGCQFSHGIVIFPRRMCLGLGSDWLMTGSPGAVVLAVTLAS